MSMVVLAHHGDVGAIELCSALPARLLRPVDLSRQGWRVELPGDRDPIAITRGGAIHGKQISGVISRITRVSPFDLAHIAARDRTYAAREMTAALFVWLRALGPRVLNSPTPRRLCGEIPLSRLSALVARGLPAAQSLRIARCVDVSLISGHLVDTRARVSSLADRLRAEPDVVARFESWAAALPVRLVRVRVQLEPYGWAGAYADALPQLSSDEALSRLRAACRRQTSQDGDGSGLG